MSSTSMWNSEVKMLIRDTFIKKIEQELKLGYALEFPEKYDETVKSGEKLPLLLFLHGMGERGNDLEMLFKEGLPRLIKSGRKFPFLTLIPQCPEESLWTDETESLHALLKEIMEKYNVDEKRIYITGISMGGFETYEMAMAYPDLFAAAVPICGGVANLMKRSYLERLTNLPMWIFHGELDPLVDVSISKTIYQTLQDLGAKDVRLTTYPDLAHDAWTRTYDNEEFYTFLASNSK